MEGITLLDVNKAKGIQAKNYNLLTRDKPSYLVNRKKKSCIIFSTFLCENAELGIYDLTLIYVYVCSVKIFYNPCTALQTLHKKICLSDATNQGCKENQQLL